MNIFIPGYGIWTACVRMQSMTHALKLAQLDFLPNKLQLESAIVLIADSVHNFTCHQPMADGLDHLAGLRIKTIH